MLRTLAPFCLARLRAIFYILSEECAARPFGGKLGRAYRYTQNGGTRTISSRVQNALKFHAKSNSNINVYVHIGYQSERTRYQPNGSKHDVL